MDFELWLYRAIKVVIAIPSLIFFTYVVFVALPRMSIRHFGRTGGIVATITAVVAFVACGYLIFWSVFVKSLFSNAFLIIASLLVSLVVTYLSWGMVGSLIAKCTGYKDESESSDGAKE